MATVSKSFTAVGNGNLIFIRSKEKFTYDVSGTFVGTVRIGRSTDGGQSWKEVAGPFTAAASGTVVNDGLDTAHYLFVCTAYTSGTIVTSMVDVTTVVNSFQNTEGNTVLAINEDGIAVTGTASVSGTATIGTVAATSGVAVSGGSVTSSTIISATKSQNSLTRSIVAGNSNAGSSAYAQASITSDAGDFNISATSTAGGADVQLRSEAGFTAGISIVAAAGQVILNSGGGNTLRATAGGVAIASIAGFGNSAAASGPVGNVVGKVRVTDGSGSYIGYLPVYDAIT